MAKVKGTIVVEVERCKGCELCIYTCPTKAIEMAKEVNGKGYQFAVLSLPDKCNGCINCALVCPDGVITVYRKKIENNVPV